MLVVLIVLFAAGMLIDLWFGQRLGQTSFILLLIAGVIRLFKNFYPKRTSRQIKLK